MIGDVEVMWRVPYIVESANGGLKQIVRGKDAPVPFPLTKASRIALNLLNDADIAEVQEFKRMQYHHQLQYGTNAQPLTIPVVGLGEDDVSSFVRDISFSPDKQFQAVAIMHGTSPILQNMATGRTFMLQPPSIPEISEGTKGVEYVSRVCWSPDGTILIATGDAGSIMIYRIITGKGQLHTYIPHAGQGTIVQAFWDHDENLVTVSHNGIMKRWEMNPLQSSLALETEVVGDHLVV